MNQDKHKTGHATAAFFLPKSPRLCLTVCVSVRMSVCVLSDDDIQNQVSGFIIPDTFAEPYETQSC